MKIVFMGTPEFAIPSLQKLLLSSHKVEAVVSAPDKERGRGRQISFSLVKQFALENGIKVYTPVNLRDTAFLNEMKNTSPDLFVVVAFRILPRELYSLPQYGSVNLHGSLLPKFRGAAPIQWAIINGEKETGVTTFFLEDKVDTGNVILQEKISINEDDDFGSLHDKLMILGADVIMKTVELIDKKEVKTTKQNNSLSSSAPKITKEICEIDFNKSAYEINNLVRALSPYPGAFFMHNGKIIKVFKTKIVSEESLNNNDWLSIEVKSINGKISVIEIIQTKKEIFIRTKENVLQVLELQPEGRKKITAEEFLRGYKFPINN